MPKRTSYSLTWHQNTQAYEARDPQFTGTLAEFFSMMPGSKKTLDLKLTLNKEQ